MQLPKTLAFSVALLTATVLTSSSVLAQETAGGNNTSPFPATRTVTIRIRYLRAADVSEMLGGNVIQLTQERPGDKGKPEISRPGWGSYGAANLLPEGIQSVTALEVDNTVIVRYDTDDALRELKYVISLVDKKPRFVAVTARTLVTFTDKRGSKQQIQVDAQGTTTSQRILHLKSASNGTLAKVGGAELISLSSEANLLAWPNGDGTINLTVDWYLDSSWRIPGDPKPLKQHNVYRTDSFVKNGGKAAITHAKVSLPFGTAEVALEITPTSLDAQAAASSAASGKARQQLQSARLSKRIFLR